MTEENNEEWHSLMPTPDGKKLVEDLARKSRTPARPFTEDELSKLREEPTDQ